MVSSIQLLKNTISDSDQAGKIFKTAAEYLQMRDWYSLRLWLRRQDAREQNLTAEEKQWLADYVKMWIRQKKDLSGCQNQGFTMLSARRKVQGLPDLDRRLFHRAYQAVTYQTGVVKLAQQLGVQIKFPRRIPSNHSVARKQEQDTSDQPF